MKLLFLFLFPCFLFSCTESDYAEIFSESFQKRRFGESLEILDNWEREHPLCMARILGLKAATYLALGDVKISKYFMDQFLQWCSFEESQDISLGSLLQTHYGILPKKKGCSKELCLLAKAMIDSESYEQPTGVKLKYWIGVGEILVGLLILPFSPSVGGTLIASGGALLIDAAADGLNNKDDWERDLQERRHIDEGLLKFPNLIGRPLWIPFLIEKVSYKKS